MRSDLTGRIEEDTSTSRPLPGKRVLITGGSGFIGSALVRDLLAENAIVCNLDIVPPAVKEHAKCWQQCQILDTASLQRAVRGFGPTHMVHLAAETEIKRSQGTIERDYPVNCRAVDILAEALRDSPPAMSVMVSTQYVCGPEGGIPKNESETFPHTLYGESKVAMESAVRDRFPFPWVIVRPTYVWGPHNKKNFLDLIRTIAGRRYIHPAGEPIIRSYGYVGSVSWFLQKALILPNIQGRVLYATDPPEDSHIFVNRLSAELTGRPVRVIPRWILRILARMGDITSVMPLNSFRYYNMTTQYPVPWEGTRALVGNPPTDLCAAAKETAAWFRESCG